MHTAGMQCAKNQCTAHILNWIHLYTESPIGTTTRNVATNRYICSQWSPSMVFFCSVTILLWPSGQGTGPMSQRSWVQTPSGVWFSSLLGMVRVRVSGFSSLAYTSLSITARQPFRMHRYTFELPTSALNPPHAMTLINFWNAIACFLYLKTGSLGPRP